MSDWHTYLLTQIASDVREIKKRLEDITTVGQRIGLLIVLWAAAVVTNADPSEVAKLIGAVIGR